MLNSNIKNILKKELKYFIPSNIKHVLIVGLGNIDNTADSIGPLVTKSVKVNFNIPNINNINKYKISALIPGVLGTTGINTDKIIQSVVKNIKPDLIILIDSLVTNNIDYINKTIEISNAGIKPGSGLHSNNKELNKKILNKEIICIGIPTALEYIHNNNNLFLSSSNIDLYVKTISNIISSTLNDLFYDKDLIVTPL